MSTKSFLDQYRWEAKTIDVPYEHCVADEEGEHWEEGETELEGYGIIGPKNKPVGFAYSADDAQKIVDALNRVPRHGPVEDEK